MQPKDLTLCGECLLYGAIQGLADGLILVDCDERIFHLNRRARELLGLGPAPITGKPIRNCLRDPGLAAFWSSAAEETVPASAELAFPHGRTIRASLSPCVSAAGASIGRALLLRDVTNEKKIRIELSESVAERLVEMTGGDASPGAIPAMSAREREILGLLTEGLTNEQIGARLNVSANTVASHLKNIFAKLGVTRRAEAAALAASHGLRPRRK